MPSLQLDGLLDGITMRPTIRFKKAGVGVDTGSGSKKPTRRPVVLTRMTKQHSKTFLTVADAMEFVKTTSSGTFYNHLRDGHPLNGWKLFDERGGPKRAIVAKPVGSAVHVKKQKRFRTSAEAMAFLSLSTSTFYARLRDGAKVQGWSICYESLPPTQPAERAQPVGAAAAAAKGKLATGTEAMTEASDTTDGSTGCYGRKITLTRVASGRTSNGSKSGGEVKHFEKILNAKEFLGCKSNSKFYARMNEGRPYNGWLISLANLTEEDDAVQQQSQDHAMYKRRPACPACKKTFKSQSSVNGHKPMCAKWNALSAKKKEAMARVQTTALVSIATTPNADVQPRRGGPNRSANSSRQMRIPKVKPTTKIMLTRVALYGGKPVQRRFAKVQDALAFLKKPYSAFTLRLKDGKPMNGWVITKEEEEEEEEVEDKSESACEEEQDSDHEFDCPACGKTVGSARGVRAHKGTCKTWNSKTDDEKSKLNQKQKSGLPELQEQVHACPACSKVFRTAISVSGHKSNCAKWNSKTEEEKTELNNRPSCDNCNTTFATAHGLRSHKGWCKGMGQAGQSSGSYRREIISHNAKQPAKNKKNPERVAEAYACPACNKSYDTTLSLRSHKGKCTSFRRFVAPVTRPEQNRQDDSEGDAEGGGSENEDEDEEEEYDDANVDADYACR